MDDSRVLVLQHARSEGLGTIEDALGGFRQSFKYLRTFEGEAVPQSAGNRAGWSSWAGRWVFMNRRSTLFLRMK